MTSCLLGRFCRGWMFKPCKMQQMYRVAHYLTYCSGILTCACTLPRPRYSTANPFVCCLPHKLVESFMFGYAGGCGSSMAVNISNLLHTFNPRSLIAARYIQTQNAISIAFGMAAAFSHRRCMLLPSPHAMTATASLHADDSCRISIAAGFRPRWSSSKEISVASDSPYTSRECSSQQLPIRIS